MDWFFDGLGTMLIGLVIGGGVGVAGGYRVGASRVKQTQKAGDQAKQTQVGGDYLRNRGRRREEQ